MMSPAATSAFSGLPVIPVNDPSLTTENKKTRAIRKIFRAREAPEGDGARVFRSIGTRELQNFTPFLVMDHFSINPDAGFPDHPHRGQETITYLLSGAIDHEDFAGNKGIIETGDLQFMTAGRGIFHAEMPHQNADGAPNVGIQLWVDLPESLKDCQPRYRDLKASEIPQATADDGKVTIKVIAGQSHGVDSLTELTYTPVWYLDITIQPGGKISQPLPRGWNAFAYTLDGTAIFSDEVNTEEVPQNHSVVFDQSGDQVVISVPETASGDARLILVAGLPLDQPILQYGPFVLTKKEDVYKAVMDYQGYTNGFERAKNWTSEISKRRRN